MIPPVFPFQTTNVIIPDPKIFFLIPVFAADTAAVNPNVIKILLTNGLKTLFIDCKLIFNNVPRNPPG